MEEITFRHPSVDTEITLRTSFPKDFIWRCITKAQSFYDPWQTKKVVELGFIKPNSVAYDAGANIGNHTVCWATQHTDTQFIAVEANPLVFQCLQENIEHNCPTNASALNAILNSSSEKMESVLKKGDEGSSVVQKACGDDAVFSRTLSEIHFSQFGQSVPCSFIKIDAEGYDFEVLKGAELLLDTFNPAIVIEVWPQDVCLKAGVPYLGSKVSDFLEAKAYRLLCKTGTNWYFQK